MSRRSRRQRPGWLAPLVAGLALLVVAVAAVAVVGVLHAERLQRRLQGLPSQVRVVEAQIKAGQLGEARATLAATESTLGSVNSSLYDAPDFAVLGLLPVGRQDLAAARSAVGVGLQLVGGAEQILNAASPLESGGGRLQLHLTGGQLPLSTLQAVQSAVADVAAGLPTDPHSPGGSLVTSSVRRAADRVYALAASERQSLTRMSEGLQLLGALAGANGRSTTLLAVANTAEMRGAGGMILSYAVLGGSSGRVSLGALGPIDQLALSAPAPGAAFPADFTATYSDLQPTQQWRDATLYPDFKVDGPVLAAMYKAATHTAAAGVVQIDPSGLAAVLDATGPLQVPGVGTVDAANVEALTLNQLYVADPNRPVRQEYLTTVAEAAFTALTTQPLVSIGPLASGLAAAVEQRHIVAWSADPGLEASITDLHAEGGLPASGTPFADLTVQNIGADKMDWYLDSTLEVTGRAPSFRPAPVEVDVTLHDTATADGRPPYIFGPHPGGTDPPGTYRGLVTVYLPRYSVLSSGQGDATTSPARFATQGGMTAVTWVVDVPAGATSVMRLHVVLPPVASTSAPFVVVPTPRVNPTVSVVNLSR